MIQITNSTKACDISQSLTWQLLSPRERQLVPFIILARKPEFEADPMQRRLICWLEWMTTVAPSRRERLFNTSQGLEDWMNLPRLPIPGTGNAYYFLAQCDPMVGEVIGFAKVGNGFFYTWLPDKMDKLFDILRPKTVQPGTISEAKPRRRFELE